MVCQSYTFLENIDSFPVFSVNIGRKPTTRVSCKTRFREQHGRINLINNFRGQNLSHVYCSSMPHEWYRFNCIAYVGFDSACIVYHGDSKRQSHECQGSAVTFVVAALHFLIAVDVAVAMLSLSFI